MLLRFTIWLFSIFDLVIFDLLIFDFRFIIDLLV